MIESENKFEETAILEVEMLDGTWSEWGRIGLRPGYMWDQEKINDFRPQCRVRFEKVPADLGDT